MPATVTNCLDDTSAANHLVPASDTQLAISCDDAGTCVNTVNATLDTPDGVRACIVVSGQGHTIQGDSAVAVRMSKPTDFITKCSPIKDVKELPHDILPSPFISDTVYAAWGRETGTSSTFSACMSTSASTVICTSATGIAGNVGDVQYCDGTCVMVYLGSQDDGNCGTGEERRFYQSVCKQGEDYSIYQLAFTDFEVRYVAVINGTSWNLWEEQPAGTVLSLSAAFENPFTNYQMARQGVNFTGAHVSPNAMDRTDCNGYCGLALQEGDSLAMTMYGNCVTPNSNCASTIAGSTCTATVQFFDQSKAGTALPMTVSGAILQYNGTNYIVQYSASAIPLKGRVEFSVPNAERVLPSEAATNVNGIVTTLLPQDADHEDVVVVYTDGAVATASRDCAFTLLETRDKNRMYSMRNVRNVTECDLLVSNGASERSLSVAAQTTKNSGATVVANATALWPAHPPGSEPRSSGLSKGAKIGIGVGVPVGVIVIACAIVLFVYRCRRKKEAKPLPNEEVVEPEVAEPPKEENPLVHPVANTEDNPTPTNAAAETQSSAEPVAREAVAAPVESVVQEVAAPSVEFVRPVFPSAPIPAAVTAGLGQNAAPLKKEPDTQPAPVIAVHKISAMPRGVPSSEYASTFPTDTMRHDSISSDELNAYNSFRGEGLGVPVSSASPSGTGVGNGSNTQSVPPRSLPATAEASQWTNVPRPPEVRPQNRTPQAKPSTRSPQLQRISDAALNSSQFSESGVGQYHSIDSSSQLSGSASRYSCFRDSFSERGAGGGTTTTQVTVSGQRATPRGGAMSSPQRPQDESDWSTSSDSLGLLDRVGRTASAVENAQLCAEFTAPRRREGAPVINRGVFQRPAKPRSDPVLVLPKPVVKKYPNIHGDPSKPEPPCQCIMGKTFEDAIIFACDNHHLGEFTPFDVCNYYDPSVVYRDVWFPMEWLVMDVREFVQKYYMRMAADAELEAGHDEDAALRAVHKVQEENEDFLDATVFDIYYGDKRVGEQSVKFATVAQRKGRRRAFSLRKRQAD